MQALWSTNGGLMMRCEVLKCTSNDGGYCLESCYVTIGQDGICNGMNIRDTGEDDEDDE